MHTQLCKPQLLSQQTNCRTIRDTQRWQKTQIMQKTAEIIPNLSMKQPYVSGISCQLYSAMQKVKMHQDIQLM